MLLSYKYINSPVGQLKLVANENALVAVLWDNENPKRVRLAELVEQTEHPVLLKTEHPVLLKTEQQLKEYFEGTRREFTLPLDFEGTAFQKQVWAALLSIPYGETRSYKEVAVQIGNEKAVRAVGAANGKNPISIIAPCHRVIGAGGALVGFAGGLDKKDILLKLEQQ
ncbi:methylated-DNA--[protein]-cysteine S-methyltransferase [Acinetobacter seifertii]|uniref:methylated-DNA--[protein]-cysteine S-methyltransferase n=1 Tax=Acinetobacter seifertii TaxID=1530123 RepID=UPI0032B4FFF0